MTPAEQAALAVLQNSPNFRVLHRMDPASLAAAPSSDGAPRERIVLLDTETTGKDHRTDKVIELGMVKFEVNPVTRAFLGVVGKYSALEDPGFPIPPEASKVNGIRDEDVHGQRFSEADIADFVKDATLVIAHNAEFDRKFCERRFPSVFTDISWGCSRHQVDWGAQGVESAKLAYIAYRLSFFYEAHRAVNDCLATLYALTRPRQDGTTALQELLGNAHKEDRHIWAMDTPYETKDILKKRGYRWSDGSEPGQPKSWHVEVPEDLMAAEVDWLGQNVYRRRTGDLPLKIAPIDARTRFSGRA